MTAGASPQAATVRVRLPVHLRTLAGVPAEVSLEVAGPVTQRSVLDALEALYPALGGTVRDRATGRRRPFIRVSSPSRATSPTRGPTPRSPGRSPRAGSPW